jgi:hypothetical protein
MPNLGGQQQQAISQNTSYRYLSKSRLQELLEQLFPGQTEFNIQVS